MAIAGTALRSKDGSDVAEAGFIPARTWHNVTNIGDEPMQVYAIYAPAHHKPGKLHGTAADAASDTDDRMVSSV